MGINVRLGCANCHYFENKIIQMPFNSIYISCPMCRENDSMYIVSINEDLKIKDIENVNINMLGQLLKIRQLKKENFNE